MPGWPFHLTDEKDVITVAAETPTDASMNTTRTAGESADTGGAESADSGALDLLLPHATVGVVRRFRPDASMARYAFRLASRPGTVAARYAKLGAELAGRSSRVVTKNRPLGTAPRQWPDRPTRCKATAIERGELM